MGNLGQYFAEGIEFSWFLERKEQISLLSLLLMLFLSTAGFKSMLYEEKVNLMASSLHLLLQLQLDHVALRSSSPDLGKYI